MPNDSRARRTAETADKKTIIQSRLVGPYGERITIESDATELTCDAGATLTWSDAIPYESEVLCVISSIKTEFGATNGTTGYQIGDGTDVDLWGDITGVAVGVTSGLTDITDFSRKVYDADTDIIITAVGGNFDGTGLLRLSVVYMRFQRHTSLTGRYIL